MNAQETEYTKLPEDIIKILKEIGPIKLMSSIDVAKRLERTRQWVDWAILNHQDFPKQIVIVNRYKGWLESDIDTFKIQLDKETAERQAKKKSNQPEKQVK